MKKEKIKSTHGGARKGSGRKKTLDGQITRSIVFDKKSDEVVDDYMQANDGNRSAAVRALVTGSTESESIKVTEGETDV